MKTKRGIFGVVRAVLVLMALALGGLALAELTHPFNVMDLDGRNGVRINPGDLYVHTHYGTNRYRFGYRTAGIGDINGDGLEDIAASMPGETSEIFNIFTLSYITLCKGRFNVIFGCAPEWPQGVESLEYLTGSRGFFLDGLAANSELGMLDMTGVGDVNGDGYSDFLVNSKAGTDSAGYLFLGTSVPNYQISKSTEESIGTVRVCASEGTSETRLSAGGVGDINGDGFDDLLFWKDSISSSSNMRGSIVLGRAGVWPKAVNINEELPGIARISLKGGSDDVASISGLGDVNGDGIDDFSIELLTYYRAPAWVVYVIYGSRTGFTDAIDIDTLDGQNGFVLRGSGAIRPIGDIVADGRNEFAVGAPWYVPEELDSTIGEHGRVSLFAYSSMASADPMTKNSFAEIHGREGDLAGTSLGLWGYDSTGSAVLAIGAPGRTYPYVPGRGSVFLLHYEAGRLASPFILEEFDAQHGVRIDGAMEYDQLGMTISSGFDFDGDGNLDGVLATPYAAVYKGETYLVYGDDGPTSLTVRRYIAPGDAPRAGVGMLGDGSHTIPHSRLWIDFGSGDDGNGNASLMTVTIRRNLDGLSNLPGPAASVHWIGEWDRPGWDGANITLKYLDSEVAGLNPARLRLYYSETPDGPWTESQHPLIDTSKKRIGGVVWSKGYYVLVEKPLASGDVNKDGGVTPADAEDAFACSIGACPPGADTDSADICPPGGDGYVTAGDAQGIFQKWLGLTPCE
ncbi:MAG: hypothetical protein PWP23_3231 [Candidatus Sumerlaeota bacterium]|nr:hypothetical protein [Candidatus Sumerlaeota bacterium]